MEVDVNNQQDYKVLYQKLLKNHIRLKKYVKRLEDELIRLRTPPLLVGTLIEVIDDRAIVRSNNGAEFLVSIASNVDKNKLIPGIKVALNQHSLAIVDVLDKEKDPDILAMEVIERPNVKYSDIGGLKEQILEIRECVELPLKNPEIFKKVGIEPPKGVLLYGPPGCGKTLLAKAVAGETNATFIGLTASELVRKYIGEGARLVRELFRLAREKAPSIVFIDEIDAIAMHRVNSDVSGDREVQRTLLQLLSEIDGFKSLDNVRIIAATNRIDLIDPALLRPGRFDRIIHIPLPDYNARIEIFRIHTRRMNLKDVDFEELSRKTEGATGADIRAICIEAGMFAIRSGREYVTMEDFYKAIDKVIGRKFDKKKNDLRYIK